MSDPVPSAVPTDPEPASGTRGSAGIPSGLDVLALARQLATLEGPKPVPPALGVRSREQQLALRHLAFPDIEVPLNNRKITRYDPNGGFETIEHATKTALPDGSLIANLDDVACWCSKFRKASQLKYCGPMTKDRANVCSRCNRVLCRHHAWQFLFSKSKHCSTCLFVRFIEVSLSLGFCAFKLTGLLLRGFWNMWFRAFR